MSDFEKQFSDRFNDAVDAKAGRRTSPPEFVPVATSRGRRTRRWLAVAAAVVIVALGAAGVFASGALRGSGPGIAATPTPAPSATQSAEASPSASPTGSQRPTATASGSTPGGVSSSAAGSFVVLGGEARIFVPSGWVVWPGAVGGEYIPLAQEQWCLGEKESECLISVSKVSDGTQTPEAYIPVDVNIPVGVRAADEYFCDDQGTLKATKANPTTSDTATFGGREAEHAVWNLRCGDEPGRGIYLEHYVVPTFTSWILYTDLRDQTPGREAAVSRALAAVAAQSQLPEAATDLRLMDAGYITAISTPDADGTFTVTLDRFFRDTLFDNQIIDDDHTTYTYTVPKAALCQTDPSECERMPSVGMAVTVLANQNGTKIEVLTSN